MHIPSSKAVILSRPSSAPLQALQKPRAHQKRVKHIHDVIAVHAHAHTFSHCTDFSHVRVELRVHRRLHQHCRSHKHVRSMFESLETAPTGLPFEILGTVSKPTEDGFLLANPIFPSAARAASHESSSTTFMILTRNCLSAQHGC